MTALSPARPRLCVGAVPRRRRGRAAGPGASWLGRAGVCDRVDRRIREPRHASRPWSLFAHRRRQVGRAQFSPPGTRRRRRDHGRRGRCEDVRAQPRQRELHVHLRRTPDADGRLVHGRDAAPGVVSVHPAAAAPATSPTRLVLTLTGSTIGFTTPAGKAVKALPAGSAVITVRDRSAARGAQLSGAGVSRSTTARFVGTVVWKVKLSAGTLVFASNAKKPLLRGGRVKVS